MRRGLIASLLTAMLLPCRLAVAQSAPCSITWDSIQQISFDSCTSYVPRILTVDDTIHVTWYNYPAYVAPDTQQGVFYAHSYDDGRSFSMPYRLAPLPAGISDKFPIAAISEGFLTASGKYLYWMFDGERFDIPPYWYWMAFRKSEDGGMSWSDTWMINQASVFNAGAIDSRLYVMYGDADTVAGHVRYFTDCMLSTNFGESFSQSANHIPVNGGWNSFVVSRTALNYFYNDLTPLGAYEVLHTRSADGGFTWSAVDTLSTVDQYHSHHPVEAADGAGNLYLVWQDYKYGSAGDLFHGSTILRKSTDDGRTWGSEQVLTLAPSAIFPRIAVHNNVVAVIWNDFVEWNHDRSVLRISTDAGVSWGDTIAVNADGGDVDVGLSRDRVFCAWFADRDIVLRKGSLSSGCYPKVIPIRYSLNQNYPNPFNGTTTIGYDLPEPTLHTTVTLYTILGQKVSTLVDAADQLPGHYEVRWDGMGHASGVYFYEIRTNAFHEVKKMILIR